MTRWLLEAFNLSCDLWGIIKIIIGKQQKDITIFYFLSFSLEVSLGSNEQSLIAVWGKNADRESSDM